MAPEIAKPISFVARIRTPPAAAERSLIAAGVRREKRKLSVDRVAATLLLQAHLDRGKRDR